MLLLVLGLPLVFDEYHLLILMLSLQNGGVTTVAFRGLKFRLVLRRLNNNISLVFKLCSKIFLLMMRTRITSILREVRCQVARRNVLYNLLSTILHPGRVHRYSLAGGALRPK